MSAPAPLCEGCPREPAGLCDGPLPVVGRDLWAGCWVRAGLTGWQWARLVPFAFPRRADTPAGRVTVPLGLMVEVCGRDFDGYVRSLV